MSALADIAAVDGSAPALIVAALIEQHGLEGARSKIDEMLSSLSNAELAAHAYDWTGFWARPKQVFPPDGWQQLGFFAGRGNGKTSGISHFINEEVEAGRALLICLIAQDEQSSIELHVTGPSGLLATAKPWFRPEWEASAKQLVWPNGARAYVRTPEVPRKIRGLEYHLAWASELQSWPSSTMMEAWTNGVEASTRLGLSRVIWDATAKRRHPLLKMLIEDAAKQPKKCRLIVGNTYENILNLGPGYIEKYERRVGGTRQGDEELFASMTEDEEGAVAKQAWIRRRPRPDRFRRTVLAMDPAVTARTGSDLTGLVVGGLCADGHAMVVEDLSGRHSMGAWADLAIDAYFKHRCDCLVLERNRGCDLLARNLRAAHRDGVEIVVLGKNEKVPLRHLPGVLYIREVYGEGEKADRAKPLGTAYERGRVLHASPASVFDEDSGRIVQAETFEKLEELLTTWTPTAGKRSPDRLDATVYLVIELLGLDSEDGGDGKAGFVGIRELAEAVQGTTPSAASHAAAPSVTAAVNLTTLLGGVRGGGRI